MPNLPSNEYVEIREGSHYYIPGTRIGLDVLIYDFRRGETPEAILHDIERGMAGARNYTRITDRR